jgi:hypothetical protein
MKIKLRKLNSAGFSHEIVLVLVVVVVSIVGAFYLVASHADNLSSNRTVGYTKLATQKLDLLNEKVSINIKACRNITEISPLWTISSVWTLSGQNTKVPGINWTSSMVNNGQNPVGGQSQTDIAFPAITHSVVTNIIDVNPQYSSPLSFTLEAGNGEKGGSQQQNIAENVDPATLDICKA